MSGRATILLKEPERAKPLQVDFYLPDQAPGRIFTVTLDGTEVLKAAVPAPGRHTLTTSPIRGQTITITIDRTFAVPGDFRELGAVLLGVGFK